MHELDTQDEYAGDLLLTDLSSKNAFSRCESGRGSHNS